MASSCSSASCFSSTNLASPLPSAPPSTIIVSSFCPISLTNPLSSRGFVKIRNRSGPPRLRRLDILCARESRSTGLTKDSWEKSVLKNDSTVLVEFYASWCGPCRMVHRIIDEIAGEYSGKLDCFVLNTDADQDVAEEYEIKAVPVVLLFKNGEKRESIVGTMPKEYYIAAIDRVLSS